MPGVPMGTGGHLLSLEGGALKHRRSLAWPSEQAGMGVEEMRISEIGWH
jgi:hypothetical protein